MAPPLLTPQSMPEPETDSEHHVERKVVYETVSASSTRSSTITMILVAVVAIALVIWIVTQM